MTCLVLVFFSAAQLLAVFALVIVIVYIYAVLSFAFLQEFFNRSDGQFCDSLLQCTVTVMHGGLLDTLSSVCFVTSINFFLSTLVSNLNFCWC